MFHRTRHLTAVVACLFFLCIAGLAQANDAPATATVEAATTVEATAAAEATADAALQGVPALQEPLPWFGPSVLHAVLAGSCVAGGEGSTGCTLGSDCSVSSSECGAGEYPCCNPDSCGCAGGSFQ